MVGGLLDLQRRLAAKRLVGVQAGRVPGRRGARRRLHRRAGPRTAGGRQQALELGRIHGQIFFRAPGPVLHAVGRGEDATETQIALGLLAGRLGAGIRRHLGRSHKQPENSQQ